jgi:hypothetical protein
MLDHIAVGPLAEKPARKDAAPFVVALILHRKLDEGAGFGGVFPWRRLFARAQSHDRASLAHRFAGLHLQFAHQPVTLVEQPQHRDALRHRGCALDAADFGGNALRLHRRRDGLAAVRGRAVASGQRRPGGKDDPDAARH